MRKPRHLSADERELWDRVARQAAPLNPARPKIALKPTTKPATSNQFASAPLPAFDVGQTADHRRSHDILPGIAERLTAAPIQMDTKSFGKLKRGKLKPEGRIDLHGMTMAEAHPELVAFILNAQSAGKRLVLVITGKGKDRDDGGPIPTRHGVLRHQVPQWLALPPISQAILQVASAHLRHGGHGALYVYLRRGR